VASAFYDVEGFIAGKCTLAPFEAEEVGDVQGRSLVHLQCHFGLDTLSWARRGASVTGLDFSRTAVEAASGLAQSIGVGARFVCADVYDAVAALGQTFDIVYTGHGALLWLPDLPRWAKVVSQLLKPGGRFYLSEFHPLVDTMAADSLQIEGSYFDEGSGIVWDEPGGSYADPQAVTEHNRTVEFRHPVSDVWQALHGAGLQVDLFRERDFTLYPRWPFLEKQADGTYRLPHGKPRLPLLYALRAHKA
jgi:SAM-dependent methyltransferase